MKFLLTSMGVTNRSIGAALTGLLNKPIGQCSALCIPTAGYYFDSGPDIAFNLVTDSRGGVMTGLGWRSVGLLELSVLPSLDPDTWMPRVRDTDVFLVGGGDPMFLCGWMRESGFADLMGSLSPEVVYVGLSAGSMAVTASFGEHYNDRPVPTSGNQTPLGLVDIAFLPHLNDPHMEDTNEAGAAAWAAGIPVPTYAVDDATALVVVDREVVVVSEGEWRVFPARTVPGDVENAPPAPTKG